MASESEDDDCSLGKNETQLFVIDYYVQFNPSFIILALNAVVFILRVFSVHS